AGTLTPAQQLSAIKTLPQDWNIYNNNALPSQNYQFTIGRVKDLENNKKLGAIASITYRNSQTKNEDLFRDYNTYRYIDNSYKFSTNLGGLANFAYNFGNNKITFSTAASQYSENRETKFNGGMLLHSDNVSSRTTYIPVEKLDPKVFVVVDTMKVGSISSPVFFNSPDGKQGYKLFSLKSKMAPHKATLEQDYAKFKEIAQQEKVNKELSMWFEKRREKSVIKIDSEFLTCDELKIWSKSAKK
ncbi:MAG: hypothetical protein EOO89_16330, partial [Pedobacter sp.]